MADFPIVNAPRDLMMTNFRAVIDDYGGLMKSARFAVQIRPVGEYLLGYRDFCQDFIYLCEIAEMPGRGFMNLDVRYYGPSHKLPFQSAYEDLNLTFLCRTESIERQFFDDWMAVINPINSFDFNYRDQYRSEIDVFQFADYSEEDENAPTAKYFLTMHNAYPILVNPQPLTWGDDQFLRLVVSFTYTHWSRRGYDPAPGYQRDLVAGRSNIR
jgi:hypothetical protein